MKKTLNNYLESSKQFERIKGGIFEEGVKQIILQGTLLNNFNH